MPDTLLGKLKHAWNAFLGRDPTKPYPYDLGPSYSSRPDRIRLTGGNEKSFVTGIYTRIGIDVSAVLMRHVRADQNGRYLETIDSGLNNCLTIEANIDQTARAFIQDVVLSMFDEGCVAIVPVDTTINPSISGSYDVQTLRTGKIVEWYPTSVRVNLYNDRSGLKEDIILPKRNVAIIENPLYAVMNEPNSILKRLVSKLNLLDVIDNQSGSGKLDLLVQVPYTIKTPARKELAMNRRQDIESQLAGSKYGIAYIDGTEKVIQLNRPADNNLMTQIEFLTSMLYGQLGLTENIFNGTADEKEFLNYYNRTVEPVLAAISDGMKRIFLTKTARSQGQSIMYFRDPFRLALAVDLANIADSFTRNEILSSNDIRGVLGYRPSDDPKADELRNKNLNPNVEASNNTEANKDPKKGKVANGEKV